DPDGVLFGNPGAEGGNRRTEVFAEGEPLLPLGAELLRPLPGFHSQLHELELERRGEVPGVEAVEFFGEHLEPHLEVKPLFLPQLDQDVQHQFTDVADHCVPPGSFPQRHTHPISAATFRARARFRSAYTWVTSARSCPSSTWAASIP